VVPGVDRRIEVFPDLDLATAALARHLRAVARQAVRERGRFEIVLSGGQTPVPLYRRLARRAGGGWPWESTEVYFADERCVPPDHPDSNFRSAWETLLSLVPIPRRQVHRIRGELADPAEAARRYARLLGPMPGRDGPNAPRFDLVLLGIGPDGHTASVFPGSAAARERRRPVVAVTAPARPPVVPRITLTLGTLSSAREVCFLVAGADKATALARTLRSAPDSDPRYPARRILPAGPTLWFVDRAAAAKIPRRVRRALAGSNAGRRNGSRR
jgi:6-phosphogluconolactonase